MKHSLIPFGDSGLFRHCFEKHEPGGRCLNCPDQNGYECMSPGCFNQPTSPYGARSGKKGYRIVRYCDQHAMVRQIEGSR